jgi:hypothetical protein
MFVCVYPSHIDIREISKKDFMLFVHKHPKQIAWAGGKNKKMSCGGKIEKNDLFHFMIKNDEWPENSKLLTTII